jgi:hypothetical protein
MSDVDTRQFVAQFDFDNQWSRLTSKVAAVCGRSIYEYFQGLSSDLKQCVGVPSSQPHLAPTGAMIFPFVQEA